jgi:hypothetical protein
MNIADSRSSGDASPSTRSFASDTLSRVSAPPLAARPPLPPSPLQSQPRQPSITWRSLLLGTVAVIAVCALTPFNDYALSNTSLISGYLPLAVVVTLFLMIVAVNAPLHRFSPANALTGGEMGVVTLMVLVACGLTNWGLMRFLIPQPVMPFHIGASDPAFWKAFTNLHLPHWLFPVANVQDGQSDTVVTWFYFRVPRGEHIPWTAWIIPLACWGVFALAMLATLAAMARLVFEQWSANERLPFPLVQVQAALIEPPRSGFALNDLFRSSALWIGLVGVLFVHSLSALKGYFPRYFPSIGVGYNLTNLLADPPWFYLDNKVKAAAISFVVVGVTYFIRSRVAFSLWAIYLMVNLVQVEEAMRHTEVPPAAWADQHLGACAAFILGTIWIGRHHWARVLRNAFGLGCNHDRAYRLAFWIAAGGVAIMTAWLLAVGVQLWMALLIVLFILAAHLLVSRVVAETGLPIYRTTILVQQVYSNLPIHWLTGRDVYFAGVFSLLGPMNSRDSMACYTMHGLGICEEESPGLTAKKKLGAVIAWAIGIGFVVAAAATLYGQYSYVTPTAADENPIRNFFGADAAPRRDMINPFNDFSHGHFTPKGHSPALHMSIGFGATVLLEIAALTFAGWPLLPVGFVACFGNPIGNAWFSIFVGWLAKVLIVRFGGAPLFQRARPFFIGIIFGEALAAALWLGVNAIVVMNGGNSQAVKFLL